MSAETFYRERGTPALLRRHVDPSYDLYPHTRLLSQKALDAVGGTSRRQIWSMPPQHGKSAMGSRALPLWFLEMYPHKRVIIASYGTELATGHSRWIRNTIEANTDKLRVRLTPDSRAANRWETPEGGGLLATGVGGAMTGFGADLLVIDDPFSNWQDAHSDTLRQLVWDWYRSTARTRVRKGGAIIVIMTRWHEDDLAGRLLLQDDEGDGEGWENVVLPAIAEDPVYDDDTGELLNPDLLGRQPGEALCPQLFPKPELEATMRTLGVYLASAMYQQHPAPPTGEMFPRSKWILGDGPIDPDADDAGLDADHEVDVYAPRQIRRASISAICRAWDLAGTEAGGDWTVGVLMARLRDGRTFVLDVQRDRLRSSNVKQLVLRTAIADRKMYGPKVAIRLEQEPGSAGKGLTEDYKEDVLQKFRDVDGQTSTGSKTVRAIPFGSAVVDGRVWLRPDRGDGSWIDDWVDEYADFPNGKHDDQVDAGSLGYKTLREMAPSRRTTRLRASADETIREQFGT